MAGTASRSPRRGSGSRMPSISTSPDSQCLPQTSKRAHGLLVGTVGEQGAVASAVELRARVVGHAAVDRHVRHLLARLLDHADAVKRQARLARRASGRARGSAAAARLASRRRAGRATRPRTRGSRAAVRPRRTGCQGRRRGRPPRAPTRARRSPSASRSSRARRGGRSSCEPMCRWTPATSRPASRAAAAAASASAGGSPNFEPWWAVRIFSCVSASIPGVTRTRARRTPAAAARCASSSASSTTNRTSRFGGGPQLLVALVVAVHDDPLALDPGAPRELELAERRDVGAEALGREQPQERDVRERLQAVERERLGRRLAVGARGVAGSSARSRRRAACRTRRRGPRRGRRRRSARRLRRRRSRGRAKARSRS